MKKKLAVILLCLCMCFVNTAVGFADSIVDGSSDAEPLSNRYYYTTETEDDFTFYKSVKVTKSDIDTTLEAADFAASVVDGLPPLTGTTIFVAQLGVDLYNMNQSGTIKISKKVKTTYKVDRLTGEKTKYRVDWIIKLQLYLKVGTLYNTRTHTLKRV